jgi:hypothetical protein
MERHMRFLFAAAIVSLFASAANATPDQPPSRECFASSNWQGWNASADGNTLYLRVTGNDVYRVELTPGAPVRKSAGYFLVNQVRGSNWICSPLDLDLTLSDEHGLRRPLIARSLQRLSAAEVAAIPAENLPN